MNTQLAALFKKSQPIEPLDQQKFLDALEEAFNLGVAQGLAPKVESTNKEEIYDKEIAPLLKLIGDRCTEANIPFVGVAEYAKASRGTTFYLPADCDLSMVMLNQCAKMGTNVDGYLMGLVKYAKEKNIDYSSSFAMKSIAGEK